VRGCGTEQPARTRDAGGDGSYGSEAMHCVDTLAGMGTEKCMCDVDDSVPLTCAPWATHTSYLNLCRAQ